MSLTGQRARSRTVGKASSVTSTCDISSGWANAGDAVLAAGHRLLHRLLHRYLRRSVRTSDILKLFHAITLRDFLLDLLARSASAMSLEISLKAKSGAQRVMMTANMRVASCSRLALTLSEPLNGHFIYNMTLLQINACGG
jgi:hypothetical protein